MHRIRIIVVGLLGLLLSFSSFGQNGNPLEAGMPLIKNYAPYLYKAYSQNWRAVQDKRGVIYFANGYGVLEFDGANWKLIPIKNNYTVTSLAIDKNDRIYVGSTNDIGFLEITKNGDYRYISLLNKVKVNDRNFSFIPNIFTTPYGVYFQAYDKIFRWYEDKMKVFPISRPSTCFKIDNVVYVWEKAKGLSFLTRDSLKKIINFVLPSDILIRNILPFNSKKSLVATREKGLFLINRISPLPNYSIGKFEVFKTQADSFLINNRIQSAQVLLNGNLAFGTLRGGTIIIDKNGKLIQILNRNVGLLNETTNFIIQDQQQALWLCLDNGIAKAESSAPLGFWSDPLGLKGSVLTLTRHNGIIYAGTWQGAYYLNTDLSGFQPTQNQQIHFKPISGINSQTWDLMEVQITPSRKVLLAATSSGVFQIEDFKAIQISTQNSFKFYRTTTDLSRIFYGGNDGIFSLKIIPSMPGKSCFREDGKIPGITDKIMYIAEEKPGVFWAASEFNGIYLVRMSPLLKTVFPLNDISKEYDFKVTPLDTANGLPPGSTYLFKMNGKNVIGTEKELFRFTGNIETIGTGRQKGKFFDYERTLTGGISFLSLYINIMHQDNKGNIWMQVSSKQTGRKMIIGALYDKKNKKYVLSSTPFKPIPESEILSIFSEKDGIVWFGGDEGLIRYNSSQTFDYSREYHCLIRKVIAERDSVIFGGNYFSTATDSTFTGISYAQPEELKARIDYSLNSIGFDFAATTFYNEESNQYRYYLEGFDKKWSDWNKITRKEYTNLSPGTYVFRVKARNIFGFESPEATYEFTILPPWYRTNFAYIMYILLFGATIFGAVKYSNRRLRKAKIRLERIVEERTQKIVEQKQQIETERDKSEKLLLNILPAEIAAELKSKGFAQTQRHASATVMFTDFKDFTKIASSIEPEELIRVLDRCFGFFDDVCLRHNVEKLKTVGDSYMCAGGIPTPTYTHPVDVVLAAFEMLDYIGKLKIEHSSQRRALWKIRIGIHTGGVIAGVVGKNKFAYDIWGDTVNVAARLEQTGKPNCINISGETYQLIKDFFICSYRGKVPAKNKGEIDMYFVDRIHPDLSADTLGRHPNHLFHEKMKQNYEAAVLEKIDDVQGEVDFNKARDYIINRLTHELNPNLFYHGVHHTLDVYDAAVRIAEMEKVTGEDLMLVKTAALYHDCGFLMKYKANEPSAVLITREVLPQFGYSQKQIDMISQMIISTELPQHPITHLDMIVCDADLDYMGRDDFFMTALTLHREWNEYGLTHSIRQWYSQQIKFVEKHHYYTASAKLLREKKKEMHIQQMKELLSIEPNN